jgi:hypothetical protein
MRIMEHGASQYMYDFANDVDWRTKLNNFFFFIDYVCIILIMEIIS